MVGITGWVSFGQDLTIRHDVLAAMTATLQQRGPDSGGLWTSEHAALGNRRLATLDLDNGAQPMSAGHATISYDGEVCNHQELLRGYLEWGTGVAERLNGMFAFALWDARAQRLVLVRDRLGVKPLHYYPTSNGVLFGSEPKAIYAHPATRREVDADGLRELFSHRPGHTVYKGLYQVKPGTIRTIDRAGSTEHVYWRLETAPHLDDAEETAAEIRRLRQDAEARQRIADVPIGTLCKQGQGDILELFRAAKQRVVIPEEGADDLFGDHRPMAGNILREDVFKTLDLDACTKDTHASAVNEIARLQTESDQHWQQRKTAYLHLTRTLPGMLDRVDRLSTAAGLEVRLPFTDHRLVEYLYNARQPSTASVRTAHNGPHVAALDGDHQVFELVDRSRVAGHLDQVLDLAAWLEIHQPHMKL